MISNAGRLLLEVLDVPLLSTRMTMKVLTIVRHACHNLVVGGVHDETNAMFVVVHICES